MVLLHNFVQQKIDEWGLDNPFFGFSTNGQLIEQWTTDLDGLEIFFNVVRNSRWIKITVLQTATGLYPEYECTYKWKGYINEWVAETAVWWAFDLLSQAEARNFMVQHKPRVQFQFMRLGHAYEFITMFDGYNWVVEE